MIKSNTKLEGYFYITVSTFVISSIAGKYVYMQCVSFMYHAMSHNVTNGYRKALFDVSTLVESKEFSKHPYVQEYKDNRSQ